VNFRAFITDSGLGGCVITPHVLIAKVFALASSMLPSVVTARMSATRATK